MRTSRPSFSLYILCAVLTLAALAACEKDEFSGAPKAVAPSSPQVAEEGAEAAGSAGRIDPGAELPPGHPPLGQVGAPAGAGKPSAPAAPAMAGAPGGVRFASPAEFGKTGPLRWEAPEGWQAAQPATSMRLAEYVAAGPEGQEPATMSIFYFGPGGGGGIDANIDRWVGQFSGGAEPRRETKEVGGMKVHLVDVSGLYNPGMAGGAPKEGQRMLGAIAESPVGAFFFKLVGPAATVAAQEEAFDAFVQSFRPGA